MLVCFLVMLVCFFCDVDMLFGDIGMLFCGANGGHGVGVGG